MRNDFKDYAHLYRLCFTHIWRSTSTLRRYLVYITNITFICAVCHQLGRDVSVRLVIAFVLARLDYCNVILAGLLMSSPH